MNEETIKKLGVLKKELFRERLAKSEDRKRLIHEMRCVAYWTMQSVLLTHDLEYKDWREIRKGDYFEKKDKIVGEIARMKFTMDRVAQYKERVGWKKR